MLLSGEVTGWFALYDDGWNAVRDVDVDGEVRMSFNEIREASFFQKITNNLVNFQGLSVVTWRVPSE